MPTAHASQAHAHRPTAPDYATYPRQFASYRWFKPLLVALLGFVLAMLIMLAISIVASAWAGDINFLDTASEGPGFYTGPGSLFGLGTIVAMLPALALATLVVRDRPFSSYSSSRGGFAWGAFAKCVGVATAIYAVDFVVEGIILPGGINQVDPLFTASGLVVCVLLVPLQCVAEEYVFRGFVLQTVGSWTRQPAIGILISTIAFTVGHSYNVVGLIGIFFNGIVWGLAVCKTRGLEATCAIHIVNNVATFFMEGFGLVEPTTQINVTSLVIVMVIDVVYVAVVLGADRRFGWFEPRVQTTPSAASPASER